MLTEKQYLQLIAFFNRVELSQYASMTYHEMAVLNEVDLSSAAVVVDLTPLSYLPMLETLHLNETYSRLLCDGNVIRMTIAGNLTKIYKPNGDTYYIAGASLKDSNANLWVGVDVGAGVEMEFSNKEIVELINGKELIMSLPEVTYLTTYLEGQIYRGYKSPNHK